MADALLSSYGVCVYLVYTYALHPSAVLAVLCYGVMYHLLYLYWLIFLTYINQNYFLARRSTTNHPVINTNNNVMVPHATLAVRGFTISPRRFSSPMFSQTGPSLPTYLMPDA